MDIVKIGVFTEYRGEYTIIQREQIVQDKGIVIQSGEHIVNIKGLNVESGNPIIQLLGNDLVTIKLHDENIFKQLAGYYIKDLNITMNKW